MPTAGSPSCEGLIDGRARGHWRDRASFPAAGDGGVLFIIYVDLRRLIYTCISKTLLLDRAGRAQLGAGAPACPRAATPRHAAATPRHATRVRTTVDNYT